MEGLSYCCYPTGRCVTIEYACTQAQLKGVGFAAWLEPAVCTLGGGPWPGGGGVAKYTNAWRHELQKAGQNDFASVDCPPGTGMYLTYLLLGKLTVSKKICGGNISNAENISKHANDIGAWGGGGERTLGSFKLVYEPRKSVAHLTASGSETRFLTTYLAAHSIGLCLICCYIKVVRLYCDVHRNAIEVGGGKTCPTQE